MTQKQATELFLAGEWLVVAEYRGSKADKMEWRDKVSKAAMSAELCRHSVEVGGVAVAVTQWVPKGSTATAESLIPNIKKGAPCVIALQDMKNERGAITVRGALIPIVG